MSAVGRVSSFAVLNCFSTECSLCKCARPLSYLAALRERHSAAASWGLKRVWTPKTQSQDLLHLRKGSIRECMKSTAYWLLSLVGTCYQVHSPLAEVAEEAEDEVAT